MDNDNGKTLTAEEFLQKCVKLWYPERHKRTYFLPPLYFNRVPYDKVSLCDKKLPVLVPSKPRCQGQPDGSESKISDSDVRDDLAQERVLRCLRKLAESQNEVMMVLSQLQFGEYLKKPAYAAAAKTLPKLRDLVPERRQGDFDVLIIHRKYGLIAGEVKSVGGLPSHQDKEQEAKNVAVKEKIHDAVKQLNKAEEVLTHLVSDLKKSAPNLNIIKVLILPNITSSDLTLCLKSFDKTAKGLRDCMGTKDNATCIAMCLCADQLSDSKTPHEISNEVEKKLCNWWDLLVSCHRFKDEASNESIASIYDSLLVRFCGPATTIRVHCVQTPRLELRTVGDGVSETGERITQLVLFPEQVELLNKSQPLVFLSGPPGTGKTMLLIIMGLSWLQNRFDVYVVSTSRESRTASYIIEHQLMKTLEKWKLQDAGKVNRYHFDFKVMSEVNSAVKCLVEASNGQHLSLLVDEIRKDIKDPVSDLCLKLKRKVMSLRFWAASVHHEAIPRYLQDEKLTLPLRSPPVVVSMVKKAVEIEKHNDVQDYQESGLPTSTYGPPVKQITHHEDQSGHTRSAPLNCVECGRLIAEVLKELHVGETIPTSISPKDASTRPPPLQYRDVLILCDDYPKDDRTGILSSKADGLVQGLREVYVDHVRVVESSVDDSAIRDTALALTDKITVTHWDDVHGIERKVVVVLAENGRLSDVYHRLRSASRCTSQLVWVGLEKLA